MFIAALFIIPKTRRTQLSLKKERITLWYIIYNGIRINSKIECRTEKIQNMDEYHKRWANGGRNKMAYFIVAPLWSFRASKTILWKQKC